jgi:hypothetical protein
MYNRLSHHIQINKILVPEPFDFQKGISTENATFKLTVCSNILNKRCMSEEYSLIYQTSYCVNHKIMLTKLNFYGIQESAADWFRSHLTEDKALKQDHLINWGMIKNMLFFKGQY